jgi:Domain of unknown function (DUF4394)
MPLSQLLRRTAVAAAVLAVGGTAAADASPRRDDDGRSKQRGTPERTLYATTDQNLLLQFGERSPERIDDVTPITGLPAGVTLRGIDFRPMTGDLYGVGSDSVVYRVNPQTAIAVAEAPAFTPALRGGSFGVDFNPTVDKIRVVSDAAQNLRLNVDEGTVLSADRDLNPGTPQVVAAGYTNSTFNATRPAATQLFVVDAASDQLLLQNPPNDGTLTMGRRLGIDVGPQTGFDIAGAENTGYLATGNRRGSSLYRVDVTTGKARSIGRIGGKRIVVTGLAASQD